MNPKSLPVPLIALVFLAGFGVIGPAYTYRLGGVRGTVYFLWVLGAGPSTVALAMLIVAVLIVAVLIVWLTKRIPAIPVVVTTLFGALVLGVGAQLAAMEYGNGSYLRSGFRNGSTETVSPGWGLWLSSITALIGTFVGYQWMRGLQKQEA